LIQPWLQQHPSVPYLSVFLFFGGVVALIGSVASSNLIGTQAIKPHRSPNFACVSLHCFLGQLLNEKNPNKTKQKKG
jgi:hypothetical protein